jgi:DNA-binding response OmpR family regulator
MTQARTILIVDSDPVEAQNLEFVVQSLGFGVTGLPGKGNDAINFATSANIDAAIIDIRSGEQMAFQIARILKERLVPFFFTTPGDRESPRVAGFKEVTLIKPLERAVIEKLLIYILNRP